MRRVSRHNRGQTVIIGALLLLGLLVTFIAWAQITQFPLINNEVEQDVHQDSINGMLELRDSINTAPSDGLIQTVQVDTRVSYPLQPARPSDNIGIFNFKTVTDPVTVANSSTGLNTESQTTFMTYEPSYIEYSSSPAIHYQHGVVAEEIGDASYVQQSEQTLIQGNDIYLSQFEISTDGVQIEDPTFMIHPINEYEKQSLTASNTNNDIKLKLKTTFNEASWENFLSSEISNGNVTSVDYEMNTGVDYNTVVINLDPNVSYTVFTGYSELEY